jgi:phosphoglycerate dehydrogenase-like enzyme
MGFWGMATEAGTETLQSQIVIAGRMGGPTGLLDDIANALESLGHQVNSFPDADVLYRNIAALRGTDVLVATPRFRCSRQLLASAPCLRGVVSPVTGIEGIDVSAATDLGVIVANGHTRENSESLAEATILLVLAALYDLHASEAILRHNLARPAQPTARMLRGKTIGMIGFGEIARAMVVRLSGWDVRMLVCARSVHTDAPGNVTWVGIDELLRRSDVVCVLASLNAETENLLNAERLRLLKPGAVLVNTARGAIIDEVALYQIAGERPDLLLALDTFTTEPLPSNSPLRSLPNAILTPHMVGHTQESIAAVPATAVENVRRILAGDLPLHTCNPDVVVRWRSRWHRERT